MKKSSYYIPILQVIILVLTISSCEKFTEGVIQEIPFPEHAPELTATLIVNDLDEKIVAHISSSASVLDTEGPQPVQGAVVTLRDAAGQTLYALSESDFNNSIYILDLESTFGTTSGLTTLTVDAPGFDQITATNTMPSKPIVDLNYEYRGDSTSSLWEGPSFQDVYTLNFGNNFGVHKNYLIHVDILLKPTVFHSDPYTRDPLELWQTKNIDLRPDPRITQYRTTGGILVTDESLASDEYALSEIKFFTRSNNRKEAPISIRVRVESLSPELASYYLSVESYLSGGLDFFAEPSLMYSNVSSGFGCFGLASEVILVVE